MNAALRGAVLAAAVALPGCASTTTVWFGLGPDRKHRVEVVEVAPGDQRVRVDGVESPPYLGVGVEGIAWSHDGARVAFAAEGARGWSVVVDGKAGPSYDGIGPILWSPDDRRLAYAAARGEKWLIVEGSVEGGLEGAEADAILAGSLVYSRDGKRFAYAVSNEADGGPRVHVVVDGEAEPDASGVGDLRFSKDGASVTYVRRIGRESALVKNGEPYAAFEAIASYTVDDSAAHVGLVMKTGGVWRVFIDGAVGPSYDRIGAIRMTGDGAHTLFAATRGVHELVVRDRVEGDLYDAIRPNSLRLTEDGRSAYAARTRDGWLIVTDDKTLGPWSEVGDPVFAGGSSFFRARTAVASFVVRNGEAQTSYAAVGEPVPSADGSHLAYVARMGSQPLLVRDGEELPLDLVLEGTLVWSPSGERLGCIVGDAAERDLAFWIDGETRPFDQEELAAAVMKAPVEDRMELRVDDALLRAWVRAELAR